jgi:hypothetical protein
LNRFSESFGDRSPLPGLLIGGVVVVLAQVSLSLLDWTDTWTVGKDQAAAPCIYEVFEDGACLGTVFCDQPQTMEGILRRLGRSDRAKLAGIERRVPRGSSIRLSRNSSEIMVRAMPGGKLMAAGKKIDVNRAQESDLSWVPGIGPKMAERLVREREYRRGFSNIRDLRTIRGIGEKKWRTLSLWLEVGESTSSSRFRMVSDGLDRSDCSANGDLHGIHRDSTASPEDCGF